MKKKYSEKVKSNYICIFLSFTFLTLFSSVQANHSEVHQYVGPIDHNPCLQVAIPKAGTHLIKRALHLLFGYKPAHARVSRIPAAFDPDDFSFQLRRAWEQNSILGTFAPHFDEIEQTIIENNHQWFFLVRDPRDCCISLVFYLEKMEGNRRDFMHVSKSYDNLNFNQKLMSIITGSDSANYLLQFYKPMMNWRIHHSGLMIRFEDLIGEAGGSSATIQRNTLISMAQHVNAIIPEERLQYTIDNIFIDRASENANGKTFQRGKHGNWRNFFNEEHIEAFKHFFGEELISLGYEESFNW